MSRHVTRPAVLILNTVNLWNTWRSLSTRKRQQQNATSFKKKKFLNALNSENARYHYVQNLSSFRPLSTNTSIRLSVLLCRYETGPLATVKRTPIVCCGEEVDLKWKTWQKVGEQWIVRSSVISTGHYKRMGATYRAQAGHEKVGRRLTEPIGIWSNMKGGAKAAHDGAVRKCKEASWLADQLFQIITAVLVLW
jgi:hypothetical protein